MSSFQQAFKDVSKLVQTFKDNESYYLSPQYQEIEARRDFIDRFFMALGWDVKHDEQKNPYAQEVKVETIVQIAHSQKRADYSFYLAPDFHTVKFFVEAKKPSRNLANNKDDFFQTVRYGWNAGTPLAVLTDFEEFIVLDCRFQPKIDDILNAKLLVFHYSDYTKEDKFREIYHLFSREALSDDSLSKYAETLPKPRGKAIQKGLFPGGFISIDEAFLEELDDIRLSLARSFKNNDNSLTSDELTEATQRTIDRLVFIRFLEDKLIEPHHYISEFGDRKSTWEDFISASHTLDAKYNGVVFKKHNIDSHYFVGPDEKTFSSICEGLAHINSPYNFDAIPIHILGSIYERFLGKVVHATAKRVNIEEKPEVRKAGGVYYTPQYIVNYIVNNTVGKLIKDKTPRQISKLRFADIACGSGSFLITIFDKLLDYHKKWYQENPEQAKKDGCLYLEGAWRLTLKQKQKILTNNIYGVDLDKQAVEVTQLSLYLKLLEDETTATANDTWVMFKEQLLPNLINNIICGNSLIGTDILEGKLFDFDEEIKLKPLDFEKVFPDIMQKGGFDAIVGNPPYITLSLGKGQLPIETIPITYLQEHYKNSSEYKINSFALFYERSLHLLKVFGKTAYIVPGTILINKYLSKIRNYIITHFHLEEIISLKYKVFKDSEMGDCAIILINKNSNKNYKIRLKEYYSSTWVKANEVLINSKDIVKIPDSRILSNQLLIKILTINKASFTTLGHIANFYNGIKTGNNKKFLAVSKINSRYEHAIRGRDFNKYTSPLPSIYILFDTKKLWSNFDESKLRVKNKIIIRQTADKITATFDKKGILCMDTVHMIYESIFDNKFLLGVINSKIFNYLHRALVPELGKAFAEIKIANLKQTPFPIFDLNINNNSIICNKISTFVDQILTVNKQLHQTKIEGDKNYLERKCERIDKGIDQLVYQLYSLTEEEIKIVEGSAQ